jgi:uncharacterized coiled-coil DUF342 family protein
LDIAQPNKSKDSPSAKRREELLSQLKEIRDKQAGGKAGRNQTFEQIKKLDEQLKSRINEQKTARSRVNFKNVEEVDWEIKRLQDQVDSGKLKIVDEKKNLAEMSNLRKQRKNFAGFEDAQKGIDETKTKLKTLRDSLDDPESKSLSERYNTIQAELDIIKAEQDDAFKNVNTLRSERDKLYHEQQDKYAAIKKIKDDYYTTNRAIKQWEWQAREKQRERQKLERENFEKEKKRERAQKMLDEAGDKAYLEEIRRAEGLLRFFDPAGYSADKAPLQAPSQLQAEVQRMIDGSDIKGTKMMRKEDREEEYFKGSGGKKGKKGKKGGAPTGESLAATPSGKYNVPPAVMEDCSSMGIDPPMSAAEIPPVTDKIKAKLDFWRKDQDAQTEKVCLHLFYSHFHSLSMLMKPTERRQGEERSRAS